jgi:hypothetical protein
LLIRQYTLTFGELRLWQEAALLFSSAVDGRGQHQIRIRTMGRLLDLVEPPTTVAGYVRPGWLKRAHEAMVGFGPDIEPPVLR